MEKVECRACGETGYTAAPDSLICKCGGRFKVIPENSQRENQGFNNRRYAKSN